MGYIKHEAIIVTGFNLAHVRLARRYAKGIYDTWAVVSPVMKSPINGYASFFIAPDGSKMGWQDDSLGNQLRDMVRLWVLEASRGKFTKGKPIYLDLVEVRYGGDDPEARVLHTDGDLG